MTATMDTTTPTTERRPYTLAQLAETSGVSRRATSRIMNLDVADPQDPGQCNALAAAAVKLGGAMTDVPIRRVAPHVGEFESWPKPRVGARTKAEKRAVGAARKRNLRFKKLMIERAALAGLTEEDLVEWCFDYIGGPHDWTGNLVKLWSQDDYQWQRAHLERHIENLLPEEHRTPSPRTFYIPECQGCGNEFRGTAPNVPLCDSCKVEAEAAKRNRTWANTCRTCDTTFTATFKDSPAPWNLKYCPKHTTD